MASRGCLKRLIVGLFLCTASVAAQDPGLASDALYAAIRENDLARLQALLAGGADVNARDPRGGATPLMYSAAVGSVEAMTLLLDKGAGVNAASASGTDPNCRSRS